MVLESDMATETSIPACALRQARLVQLKELIRGHTRNQIPLFVGTCLQHVEQIGRQLELITFHNQLKLLRKWSKQSEFIHHCEDKLNWFVENNSAKLSSTISWMQATNIVSTRSWVIKYAPAFSTYRLPCSPNTRKMQSHPGLHNTKRLLMTKCSPMTAPNNISMPNVHEFNLGCTAAETRSLWAGETFLLVNEGFTIHLKQIDDDA